MDAKFQASFIPKQSLAPTPQAPLGHLSLFYVIALVIFIITLGLLGAVFIAKGVLTRDITNLNQTLIEAKNSFELSTIDELKRTSQRLQATTKLLDQHTALSKFLEALQVSTYENVAFSSFSSTVAGTGVVTVSLQGLAKSFNTLTLQSERFMSLPYLKSPAFSNFDLDEEGNIGFSFSATIDPSLISYKRYVIEE